MRHENREPELGIGFFASLSLHLLALLIFILYAWWLQKHPPAAPSFAPHDALQTRVLSPQEMALLDRRIVETAKSHDNIAPKDHALFQSDKTQRTSKQTRAKNMGAVNGGMPQKHDEQEEAEQETKLNRLGFGAGFGRLVHRRQENSDGSILMSGDFQDLPKDIAAGADTILNTDEYVYSSFYNRFTSEVAGRWTPLVQSIIYGGKVNLHEGSYYTQMIITLDPDGKIVDIALERSSGVPAFDEAARTSIAQVIHVNNVPTPLIDPDGKARIKFGFHVDLSSGVHFQSNSIPDPRLGMPQ